MYASKLNYGKCFITARKANKLRAYAKALAASGKWPASKDGGVFYSNYFKALTKI